MKKDSMAVLWSFGNDKQDFLNARHRRRTGGGIKERVAHRPLV